MPSWHWTSQVGSITRAARASSLLNQPPPAVPSAIWFWPSGGSGQNYAPSTPSHWRFVTTWANALFASFLTLEYSISTIYILSKAKYRSVYAGADFHFGGSVTLTIHYTKSLHYTYSINHSWDTIMIHICSESNFFLTYESCLLPIWQLKLMASHSFVKIYSLFTDKVWVLHWYFFKN